MLYTFIYAMKNIIFFSPLHSLGFYNANQRNFSVFLVFSVYPFLFHSNEFTPHFAINFHKFFLSSSLYRNFVCYEEVVCVGMMTTNYHYCMKKIRFQVKFCLISRRFCPVEKFRKLDSSWKWEKRDIFYLKIKQSEDNLLRIRCRWNITSSGLHLCGWWNTIKKNERKIEERKFNQKSTKWKHLRFSIFYINFALPNTT